MKEKKLSRQINKLAIMGKIPISFYNSDITIDNKFSDKMKKISLETKVNKRYYQNNVANGYSGKLISKSYDIL